MINSDQINSVLELFGSLFLIPSIIEAYRKKIIMGVHWSTPIFFTSWGLWNIFYYPTFGQSWSGFAAIIMFLANIVWLVEVLVYSNKPNREGSFN